MKKLIQRFRLPISIGLAFCTTFALIFGGIVSLGSSAYSSGNILALLVFAAISLLFYKTLPLIKEPNKRAKALHPWRLHGAYLCCLFYHRADVWGYPP